MEKRVKHIVTPTMDAEQKGTHSLYLGLRHSKEKWNLAVYPVDEVLIELENVERKEDVKQGKKQSEGKAQGKTAAKK